MENINGIEVNSEYVDNVEIVIINIQRYTTEIKELIMNNLLSICDGELSFSQIDDMKSKMKNFFISKSEDIKKGAVAEFCVHLYLKSRMFKQECKFFNLEERSIKKGFDGFYTYDNKAWIMESKAGLYKTKSGKNTHTQKISLAYKDLKEKLNGENQANNPWDNAKQHASLLEVNPNRKLVQELSKLSSEYASESYQHTISDFNIIPAATIYHDGVYENYSSIISSIDKKELLKQVQDYKELKIICITNETYNRFIELFI